jgi:hypothetical protein
MKGVKTLFVKKNSNNHIFSVVVLLRLFVSERRRHEKTPIFFCLEDPNSASSLKEEEIAVSGKMRVSSSFR